MGKFDTIKMANLPYRPVLVDYWHMKSSINTDTGASDIKSQQLFLLHANYFHLQ